MNIGFFIRHFTERGTEVAIYDYAKYNEEILNNKSYIICFTEKTQRNIGFPTERISYDKFNSRFPIIEINNMEEMQQIINQYKLSFFYTLTHGGNDAIYQFNNKNIWTNCKTIKHCVFNTTCIEGDFYISISNYLNEKYNTNIPVIPHIVDLPNCDENLRNELNIPNDAMVFGRYGGKDTFDIQIAHEAIIEYLNNNDAVYFLFMNTNHFYYHPRIIYLEGTTDNFYKVKFINTCDSMIHARNGGETFGLSIAEFSIKNKPIITCPCGDLEHIKILQDKAILYTSKQQLIDIFKNIKLIINSREDWNAFDYFSPRNIMGLFSKIFL
uniref:Glycosyl transferase family 1 domain-containing protein n=1 Tax=viral metagenome TaxID=1070528 RepID=A0A6C0DUX1_9ZZZZ